MAKQTKIRKISKKRTKKGSKQLTPDMGLELDGAVYLVEFDKNGNIISRSEIDGKAVLDAVIYVLTQMMKKNKTP